jgi:hypothetical protein
MELEKRKIFEAVEQGNHKANFIKNYQTVLNEQQEVKDLNKIAEKKMNETFYKAQAQKLEGEEQQRN